MSGATCHFCGKPVRWWERLIGRVCQAWCRRCEYILDAHIRCCHTMNDSDEGIGICTRGGANG
jgi:hypothetical protein